MQDFNDTVDQASIIEMTYKCPCFTWDNKHYGANLVLFKIDKCFSNEKFLKRYTNYWMEIKSTPVNDHKILGANVDTNIVTRKTPFRHINAWLSFT